MSSRLDNLNIVPSPKDGNNGFDLGVESIELSKQLEMWTNVPFAEEHAYAGFQDFDKSKLVNSNGENPYSLLENRFASFPDNGQNTTGSYAADGSHLLFPEIAFNFGQQEQEQSQQGQEQQQHEQQSTVASSSSTSPASASVSAQHTPSTNANANEEEPSNKKRRSAKRSTPTKATNNASPEPKTEQKSPEDGDKDRERELIEEDRRRRNTLASARFRVKKKQREAALAQHASELESKVSELEKTIDGLRTENTWLRSLITESTLNKKRSIDETQQ